MDNVLTIEILKNGLQVLIQDTGRSGHQDQGIPVGGAMDAYSAGLANYLIGKSPSDPVIEIAMMGPKISFDKAIQIALTGADLSPKVNNVSIPMNESLTLEAGSILTFGKREKGCRAYLSIGGKWDLEKWMNSYAPIPHANTELNYRRILRKEDKIKITVPDSHIAMKIPNLEYTDLSAEKTVRVLKGPEFDDFDRESIAAFFGCKFQLNSDSNRMGYRLNNPFKDYKNEKELISSPTLPGTIQITNQGFPILLMKDAQTTGGYPRIANVIAADMDSVGQLSPGDCVRFQLIDLEEAVLALEEHRRNSTWLFA